LVSEIFDVKVADKHTNPQTSTLSDNKGPLKLSAREPIFSIVCIDYAPTPAKAAVVWAKAMLPGS